MNINDEAKKGYKFKVDLHIPESLHDHFNNYVPLPENMKVQKKNLSQVLEYFSLKLPSFDFTDTLSCDMANC
jgi:hypothetical protein